MFYYKIRQMSGLHPFFPACVFPALLSLALTPWQEGANRTCGGSPAGSPMDRAWKRLWWVVAAHCALEAVVVVEAAPLAEATVKREFWMDSAEVEVA